MDITNTQVITLPLSALHTNTGQIAGVKRNPRILRDDKYKALLNSLRADNLTGVLPLKVYNNGGEWVVIGGNMRLQALKELGAKECACIEVPQDTPADVLNKIVIIDNSTFGEWDWDALANEWDEVELQDWGVDVPMSKEQRENYSRKVEAPIYKPTMDVKPEVSEVYDLTKYKELCAHIESANLKTEQKEFLRLAASRHIVFDYAMIAELYAQESKEMQELMEESALVIIDFNKAIESGFVRMTERINALTPPHN